MHIDGPLGSENTFFFLLLFCCFFLGGGGGGGRVSSADYTLRVDCAAQLRQV